jgi:glycerophosphoryl diester phosphodiesterase
MKKSLTYICIIFSILIFTNSCENTIAINYPSFDNQSWLGKSVKINDSILTKLQGIYYSETPQKKLGSNLVVKSNRNKIMLFCQQAIDFVILDGGILDSGIVFEGYGRDLETENVNLVRVFIRNNEGANSILQGKRPDTLIMNVEIVYDSQTNESSNFVKYTFVREIDLSNKFKIIAHRGGARNSDLLPASENSREIIRLAEYLGATGIEIDIRLTKDKVPVLFHDDYITTRLVNSDFLIGSIENYTLAQLKTFCRLKHNETIPTLEEAFSTIVDETTLDFVWLDIKTTSVIDAIVPIIDKYNKIAKGKNRKVEFYIGITSPAVEKQVLEKENRDELLTLSELSPKEVIQSKSKIWAPTWTAGYQDSEVEQLKSNGIKSYVWTMDERNFIRDFIKNSKFDGILTNFAPIVAYEYYMQSK